jgi:DNA modification methylase
MTPILAAKIEHWPIERLVPYARNARTHSPSQVEQIARSIQTFGFTSPILVDGAQGVLAGHGRLQAARSLKLAIVPVIVLDHLTEAERRAYVLADNQLAINAGWDDDVLAAELRAIQDMDFGLDVIGFDERELAKMLGEPDDAAADECPEVRERAVTVAGDLWLLGRHRLLCGDAMRPDDVERVMAGERADMVFTDPPYGVRFQSGMSKGGTATRFDRLLNDDVILEIGPVVEVVLKANGVAYIWTSQRVYPAWRAQFAGLYKSTIIWHKPGGGIGDLTGDYAADYEMCLFCVKGRVEFRGKRGMAVWVVSKDGVNEYVHPTQKPVELARRAINDFTDAGERVCDLFGGSGSTLIACEKTDRAARLVEIEPLYCDVIVKRWQTYTGQQATRERDGRTFDECRIAADELAIPLATLEGQIKLGARDLIADEAFS